MRALGTTLAATLLPLAALALACGPGLDPPSVVERTRIVAARVAPAEDPTIAWPAPGDAIAIDWIVVYPVAPEPIAASLVACAQLPGATGTPACVDGTIVPLAPRAPSTEPFRTELVVPDAAGLRGASSLLVTGAVCAGGGVPAIPTSPTSVPDCEGGPEPARAELVVLSIPLSLDPAATPPNHHPSLADEPWTLDGTPWELPASEPPREGCASAADVARITADPAREITITIGASADDREEHTLVSGDPPAPTTARETLQINHFATHGRLARAVSAVDDGATDDPPIQVGWTLPAADEVPEGGLLVRVTAVARDGRGGVDHAERVVCVTR